MSQLWIACSDRRIRASPAVSRSIPNISRRNRSRWPASSDSSRWISASLACSESAACARGARAFQASQIGGNASRPGGSCPVRPALSHRPKTSACDPRCESTWAIDQSEQ